MERREEERREGWEAQRAEGLLHDVANVVGILPAMSRPLLHEKRPCSNRFGKTQKMREKQEKNKFEQSEHWFVALGSAISGNQAQGNDLGQTALVQEWPNNCEKPTENATKLTAHSSRHCPKSSKILLKHGKKRQIHVKNQQKIPQKQGKNDNLMSKIDQQRVLCFRNLSASKDFNVHLNRTLAFFLGKSDSKKGGGSY